MYDFTFSKCGDLFNWAIEVCIHDTNFKAFFLEKKKEAK